MSLLYLQKRREIEGIYKKLESIRKDMKSMIIFGKDYFTTGNITLLELEETRLLNKLVKLKSIN